MRVAFLHGFAGDPASWDEVLSVWPTAIAGVDVEPVVPALPGHNTPIADDWAGNLARIGEAIGDARIAVGYSLGARVALGLLATDRIRHAVLISVNPGLDSTAARAERSKNDEAWARRLRTDGIAAFAEAWAAQALFASQVRADPMVRAARLARRLRLDPSGLARSLETMGLAAMPDYRAALASRADRAHLIVGADDTRFVAIARGLVAECPGLAMDCVTEAGHDLTLEQPIALAGGLARVIARWFSDRPVE
jgi:2-succinyl-6-hydroxy-2,4-cyclohexadiene-1-carboxylate synthase